MSVRLKIRRSRIYIRQLISLIPAVKVNLNKRILELNISTQALSSRCKIREEIIVVLKAWIAIGQSLTTNSNIMESSLSSFKPRKTVCIFRRPILTRISIDNLLDRFLNLLKMQPRFILNINKQNIILIRIRTTLITR